MIIPVIQVASLLFINLGDTLGNQYLALQPPVLRTSMYLYTAFTLALIGFLFIIVLYTRRIVISAKDKKTEDLRFKYQYLIYEALIESQANTESVSSQLIIEKLKKDTRKTKLHTQVLADLIIDLKKNFSGESEKQFIYLYQALNLSQYSLDKLKIPRWDIQAKGIRELTEMNCDHVDTQVAVTNLRYTKNRTVAQEAQIASVRLEKNPLSFLTNLQHPLTEWQQINLHQSLLKTDRKSLPDFTQWLASANQSVVLFALKMIADFEQKYTEPKVMQCLTHPLIPIREEAIHTLIKLKAKNVIPQILEACRECSETLHLTVIKLVAQIGDPQHTTEVEPFLQHPSEKIRQTAEQVIKKLNHPAQRKITAKHETIKNSKII